jgi:hypothetical protein
VTSQQALHALIVDEAEASTGKRITLIDQNGHGYYSDHGEDAIIVGSGDMASLTNRAVNIKGEWLQIEIQTDGCRITSEPFESET